MWTYRIHDTITGAPLMKLEAVSSSWRTSFGRGHGSTTIRFPQRASRALCDKLSEPNATTISVAWNRTPMYAGLVLTDEWDEDTGLTTIEHSEGPRGLLDERFSFGVGTPRPNLNITSRSAAGAVRAILHRYAGGEWGSTWDLPIDWPTDGSGNITIPVKWWEWLTGDDLLTQIEAEGYEIEFEPYFVTGTDTLRYRTRVGSRLTANTLEFHYSAPKTLVHELKQVREGSQQLSGVFTLGKGSEEDMRVGEAGYVGGPRIPVRDAARNQKDISNIARLDRISMADLLEHRSPLKLYKFKLTADRLDAANPFNLASLRTGTKIRLHVHGSQRIPSGPLDLRVIALSGDESTTITPEVALW